MTGRFPLKYGQFVCKAFREVEFRYLTMTGQEMQDGK